MAVNNVAKGFLVFFGKNREKSDLSGTDCGSDFERERTRPIRNCFAAVDDDDDDDDVDVDDAVATTAVVVDEFVVVVGDFDIGNTDAATGITALACKESAATIFECSLISSLPFVPPPGPDELFVGFESVATKLADPAVVFLSFALLRGKNTAWNRFRFVDPSEFCLFGETDRFKLTWSVPSVAELVSF